MKQQRKLSVLAAGAVVIGLLLGAGTAQAADVVIENGNVTRINNLELNFDRDEFDGFYDVEFINGTGLAIYGSADGPFDFPAEEAAAAIIQVNNTLNTNPPVATGASSAGTKRYFIPAIEYFGLWAAFGGEYFSTAGGWDACESPECLSGIGALRPSETTTYAVFSAASGGTPDPVAIAASSLPSSRSVQVGSLASVFATIINGGSVTATDCSIMPQTIVAADFAYQTTDASNVPVGSPNTPADIPAGGSQNFIFAFTPTAPISPTEVLMTYDCTNSAPAPVSVGLNTLLLSAEAAPVPDIVALAATPTGDGIVNLPGTNGSNAFAVSTVNVGSTATITAEPVLSTTLPVAMSICETNASGACLSAAGSSTTSTVAGGATPTYSVFVTGAGTVPFDPANNRIIVDFRDGGGTVRGSTSVAVRTQ